MAAAASHIERIRRDFPILKPVPRHQDRSAETQSQLTKEKSHGRDFTGVDRADSAHGCGPGEEPDPGSRGGRLRPAGRGLGVDRDGKEQLSGTIFVDLPNATDSGPPEAFEDLLSTDAPIFSRRDELSTLGHTLHELHKRSSDSLPAVFLVDAEVGEKRLTKQPSGLVADVANDNTAMGCYEEASSFNFSESIAAKFVEVGYERSVVRLTMADFNLQSSYQGEGFRRLRDRSETS